MKCVRGSSRYLEALIELEIACFEEGRREDLRYWKRMLNSSAAEIWLLLDEGRLAGSLLLTRRRTTLRVDSIAVDPIYQGKGIGRLLMKKALTRAKALGAYRIALEASEELPRLAAWYRGNGFRPCRFLPDYYGSGKHARRFHLLLSAPTVGHRL